MKWSVRFSGLLWIAAVLAFVRPVGAADGEMSDDQVLEIWRNMVSAQVLSSELSALDYLRAMVSPLALYFQGHHSYPDDWQADLYATQSRSSSPPPSELNVDIQARAETVQGYDYRYFPKPDGCKESTCVGFVITAVPHGSGGRDRPTAEEQQIIRELRTASTRGQTASDTLNITQRLSAALSRTTTGTRSFFVDESATIRHCVGTNGADSTDVTVNEIPGSC